MPFLAPTNWIREEMLESGNLFPPRLARQSPHVSTTLDIIFQKLHPEMLQRLGIRQAKARHLPMHLHAHSIVLPEFRDGRNLFISARLPPHFVQNMKWLKLKFT